MNARQALFAADWPGSALILLAAEPPVQPDRDEARRWAVEELSKREYRDAEPDWLAELWRQFLDWLQSLGDGQATAEGTPTAPLIGIGIAVLLGVAIILARPRLNTRRRAPKEVFDADDGVTAAAYRRQAAAAAARGDWPAAVVDQFRALVRSAEDRAVLEPQPGRTADEAAEQLSRVFRPAAGRLAEAARVFDSVRYGSSSAEAADHAAMADLDSTLDSLTPTYADSASAGLAVPK
ncbi:hypothetical protein ASG92_08530 [Arthrobacter sp. Soil736]|uniref:DUF4129 domain-containing protein n=1 Tax=Arthrobacter sp. Soil736 TaxID=1736395 RepID=UPI0006FF972D|nr:DUF4129 domain-containing protein [Arthrobacter sp. Soil736]KRE50333.1 hypothetical protein ASG92_08530 [Arthrobacter sp. Soil736]